MLLRRIHASRREGYGHIVTHVLRGLLDAGATAQNDHVRKRHLLPAGLCVVELLLDALKGSEDLRQLGRLVDFQSFCGARRIPRPVRTAALVGPRNVDADAQAVGTSSEIDRPEARILPLRFAMSAASINS